MPAIVLLNTEDAEVCLNRQMTRKKQNTIIGKKMHLFVLWVRARK
jgi:hypothetical protein